MTILRKLAILLLFASFQTSAANQWNGIGEIKSMSIYPDYAIIEQGDPGGVAGCSSYGLFSFNWSDFTAEQQARIQSILLHAYTTNASIQVLVSSDTCGPEGHKKFQGHIQYK